MWLEGQLTGLLFRMTASDISTSYIQTVNQSSDDCNYDRRKGYWLLWSNKVCMGRRSGWIDGSTKQWTLSLETSILSPMSYHHFFKHYPALWETGMLLFFSHLWEIPKVSAAAWTQSFHDLNRRLPDDTGVISVSFYRAWTNNEFCLLIWRTSKLVNSSQADTSKWLWWSLDLL